MLVCSDIDKELRLAGLIVPVAFLGRVEVASWSLQMSMAWKGKQHLDVSSIYSLVNSVSISLMRKEQ